MARPRATKRAETYRHEEEALLWPEVGTQAQFKKRKPPKTYRYGSSLSPALDWDGGNAARELGECGFLDGEAGLRSASLAPQLRRRRHEDLGAEQSAAYYIDKHPRVASFVKNQGLGFGIPYLHDGQAHEYVQDFIVRLDNSLQLILETKGHDPLEEIKSNAAQRWVDAVNADGAFGEWRYAIVHEMAEVGVAIEETLAFASHGAHRK